MPATAAPPATPGDRARAAIHGVAAWALALRAAARQGGLMALACLAFAAGCAPDLLSPRLRSVSPAFGYNGVATDVEIRGDELGPSLRALGAGDIDEDIDFELWLIADGERVRLRAVESVDGETLRAQVPAGAAPGVYGLELRGEAGAIDTLPDAFQVTDTRADRIRVESAALNFQVREAARIDLQLVDPAGSEVGLPVEVELRATRGEGGAAGLRFDEGLVDQVDLGDGAVRGWLEAGGGATLRLTSDVVDRVRVAARGIGENAFLEGEGEWMYFEAGSLAGVRVEPLIDGDSVTAGQTFPLRLTLVDSDGNPTKGERAWLTVHETCAPSGPGFELLVRVDDSATLPGAYLTGASDPERCTANQIRAFGSAEGAAVVGVSVPISVQPGPLRRLAVEAARAEVRAGEEDQPVWVEALDAFGNHAEDPDGALVFRDDAGGLDTEAGVGAARCTSFSGGIAACDLRLVRAGSAVRVDAAVDGAEGTTSPFAVLPGTPSALIAEGPPSATAGRGFAIALRLEDDWGNARALAPDEAATATWEDGTAGLTCAGAGGADPGALSCVTTLARSGARVSVHLGLPALSGRTAPFDVLNGDLANVTVSAVSTSPMTAGDRRVFELLGADAWGNPYTHGGPAAVELAEAAGGPGIGTVTLGSGGAATVNPQMVVASPANALVVRTGAAELGRSAAFVVEPAGWSRLALSALPPWVEAGATVDVVVRATDVFDNTTPSAVGTVTLQSVGGQGALVEAPLSGGEATLSFTWDTAGVEDRLAATVGAMAAQSSLIDVVDLGCGSAPLVTVLLDGRDEVRLCRVIGSTPVVTVTGAAITSGVPVAAWHVDDGAGGISRNTTGAATARWTEPGGYAVRALAITAEGCGAWGEAAAWVGDADGSPVGPVLVEVGASSLAADDAARSGAPVTFTAEDCLGDPASNAALWVRAELGVLDDDASTIDRTDGLRVILDRDGAATLWWDVYGAPLPGLGRVLAGVPSGAAWGVGTAAVTGDNALPTVVDVQPGGAWGAPVPVLTVRFSEPMWPGSVRPDRVAVNAPDGAPVDLAATALSVDRRALHIEPAAPLSGGMGPFSLWLSGDLRDEAGLKLDGAGTGGRSDFDALVGLPESAPPGLISCGASGPTFSPDGSGGVGAAADTVELVASAAATPARWRLRVIDTAGEERRTLIFSATGTSTRASWAGEGDDGRILPEGDYLLDLRPLDSAWGEGNACEALVRLTQRFPTPAGWR